LVRVLEHAVIGPDRNDRVGAIGVQVARTTIDGGVANAVVPPETGKRFGRAGFRRFHTGAVVRVPRGDVLKLEGLATPRGSPLDFRRGNQVSIEGHVVKVSPIVAINLDGPCTVPRVVLGARFAP